MAETKSRNHVSSVITSDNRSKPYVPQVITFYTHKDGKAATTIPPPAPVIRRTPPLKTPDLPPWNPSTQVEKPKRYSRPQPLHYRRHESCHSLGSQHSEGASGKFSLAREDASLDGMSPYLQETSHSDAQHADCPSKKPPAYPKQPFRPAGTTTERRRAMPVSNSDRCHPELRVPSGKTDVPVAYPSMKSASNSTSRTSRDGDDSMVFDELLGSLQQCNSAYSPGPDSYVYPAYTAPVNQSNNNNYTSGEPSHEEDATPGESGEMSDYSSYPTGLAGLRGNSSYPTGMTGLHGNGSSPNSSHSFIPATRLRVPHRHHFYAGRYPMLPGVSKHTLRYLYKCSPLQEAKQVRRPSRPHLPKSPASTPLNPLTPQSSFPNPLLNAPPILSNRIGKRWNAVLVNRYLEPPEDLADTGLPITDVALAH